MYSSEELTYMRQAKKKAKAALKLKQLKRLQDDSKIDSGDSKS